MYEEIVSLESEIIKTIDRFRERHELPVALVVGVLEVIKGVTIANGIELSRPVETMSACGTIVEENLESI